MGAKVQRTVIYVAQRPKKIFPIASAAALLRRGSGTGDGKSFMFGVLQILRSSGAFRGGQLNPQAISPARRLPLGPWCYHQPLRNNPIQNRFLHVQPVFRLRENRVRIGLECFFVNFFAAIRGQAMHHQRVRFGEFEHLLLIW